MSDTRWKRKLIMMPRALGDVPITGRSSTRGPRGHPERRRGTCGSARDTMPTTMMATSADRDEQHEVEAPDPAFVEPAHALRVDEHRTEPQAGEERRRHALAGPCRGTRPSWRACRPRRSAARRPRTASSIATSSLVPSTTNSSYCTPHSTRCLAPGARPSGCTWWTSSAPIVERALRDRVEVADDDVGLEPDLEERVGAAVDADEHRLVLTDVRAQRAEVVLGSRGRARRRARAGPWICVVQRRQLERLERELRFRCRCTRACSPRTARARCRSPARASSIAASISSASRSVAGRRAARRRARPRRRRRAPTSPSATRSSTSVAESSTSGIPASTTRIGPPFGYRPADRRRRVHDRDHARSMSPSAATRSRSPWSMTAISPGCEPLHEVLRAAVDPRRTPITLGVGRGRRACGASRLIGSAPGSMICPRRPSGRCQQLLGVAAGVVGLVRRRPASATARAPARRRRRRRPAHRPVRRARSPSRRTTWASAQAATWARWVTHSTWWRRPRSARSRPTAVPASPPIPASTSSNTSVGGASEQHQAQRQHRPRRARRPTRPGPAAGRLARVRGEQERDGIGAVLARLARLDRDVDRGVRAWPAPAGAAVTASAEGAGAGHAGPAGQTSAAATRPRARRRGAPARLRLRGRVLVVALELGEPRPRLVPRTRARRRASRRTCAAARGAAGGARGPPRAAPGSSTTRVGRDAQLARELGELGLEHRRAARRARRTGVAARASGPAAAPSASTPASSTACVRGRERLAVRGGVGEQRLLGFERVVLARIVDLRGVDLVDLEPQQVELRGRGRARRRRARRARRRSSRVGAGGAQRRPARRARRRAGEPVERGALHGRREQALVRVLAVQVDELAPDVRELARRSRAGRRRRRAPRPSARHDPREHVLLAVGGPRSGPRRAPRPRRRARATASARPPSSSSSASTSSVLPAPVSPVIAVRPGAEQAA